MSAQNPDFDEVLQTAEGGNTPLILLMGPQRAGKTSIVRVLFGKLSPHDTSFLEPTTTPQGIIYPPPSSTSAKEALLKCRIIDLPGSQTFLKQQASLVERLLQASASIVFVIDAAADSTWTEASQSLIQLLTTMEQNDIQRPVSVFLHKIDTESYNNDIRTQYTDLRRSLLDALRSASIRLPVTFFVTSLYDISIFESFSRLMIQLIPKTNLLGTLLDGFISACGIEKAYIVDTNSKLYVGSDSTTPDISLFNLLCDTIDLVFDIGFVYSPNQDYEDEDGEYEDQSGQTGVNRALNELQSLQSGAIPASQPSNNQPSQGQGSTGKDSGKAADDDADFDCYSAEISLFNGSRLYLRQINGYLSLMFTLRSEGAQMGNKNNKGLLEHNITCLKQALAEIFDINCYGIQPRNQRYTGNGITGGGGSGSEYGVQQYMGSYASQSAIANLKQYYGTIGSSMPAKSYIGGGGSSFMAPSSFAQNTNKMAPMNGVVGSSRTPAFNNFHNQDSQQQGGMGSLPHFNHSARQ